MTKKSWLLLAIIFLIGFSLRFYRLGSYPVELSPKEVSLGYQAFSLVKTGHLITLGQDDTNHISLLSVILVAGAEKVFSLTSFAVRFWSAAFGVLTIVASFFLARRFSTTTKLPFFAALFIAVSPWHIILSRSSAESIIGLFFLVVGLWCFLGLGKIRPVFAVAFFALASYFAPPFGLFALLALCVIAICYRRNLIAWTRTAMVSLVLVGLLTLPLIWQTFLALPTISHLVEQLVLFLGPDANGALLPAVFANLGMQLVKLTLTATFTILSPSFLFLSHERDRLATTPFFAYDYLVNLPFYLIGLYALTRASFTHKRFLFICYFVAPLLVIVGNETELPETLLVFLIALALVTAYGIWYVVTRPHRRVFRYLTTAVYLLVLLANTAYFLDFYFVHVPKRMKQYGLFPYKMLMSTIEDSRSAFPNVVVSDKDPNAKLYYLFYSQTDPTTVDFSSNVVNSLTFRTINWPYDQQVPNTLFIATDQEILDSALQQNINVQLLRRISFPDGSTAFKIVTVQEQR